MDCSCDLPCDTCLSPSLHQAVVTTTACTLKLGPWFATPFPCLLRPCRRTWCQKGCKQADGVRLQICKPACLLQMVLTTLAEQPTCCPGSSWVLACPTCFDKQLTAGEVCCGALQTYWWTHSCCQATSGGLQVQRICLMAPVRASQVAGIRGHQAGGIDAPRGHHSTIPNACEAVPAVAPHHLQHILLFYSLGVCCTDLSNSMCPLQLPAATTCST